MSTFIGFIAYTNEGQYKGFLKNYTCLCSDFDPVTGGQRDDKKERYLLDYLGSVETSLYKGNIVLCQAIRKISLQGETLCQPPRCTVLEISDKGIKMLDKSKSNVSICFFIFLTITNVLLSIPYLVYKPHFGT